MKGKILELIREEEGQSMVEYGLIIGLVSVVVITILTTLGGEIQAIFQRVVDELQTTN